MIKLTVQETLSKYKTVQDILGMRVKDWKTSFALREIRKILKPILEGQDGYSKMLSDLYKEKDKLTIKHCTKDDKGQVIILSDKTYKGLYLGENLDYDKAIEENKELQLEILNKEIELEFTDCKLTELMIEQSAKKYDLTGNQIDDLLILIGK